VEGKKFKSFIGGYRVVSVQAASEGGGGAEPTPPELLLAALGACAGHCVIEYLRARAQPLSGLRVYVSAEKAECPARLDSFRVVVDLPGIEERHQQGVLRVVKACLIHNTLAMTPAIAVEVSGAAQELSLRVCTAVAPAL
jgi:putative redox protein